MQARQRKPACLPEQLLCSALGSLPSAASAAAIEAFVDLDDEEADVLRRLSDVPLRNWNGIEVGALRATTELREGLHR